MRHLAIALVLLGSAAARAQEEEDRGEEMGPLVAAGNRALCEVRWPALKKPTVAQSFTCTRYWLFNYGGYSVEAARENLDEALAMDPVSNGAIVTKLTAAQLTAMARHAKIACGKKCGEIISVESRAVEMFEGAAASHFSLFDSGAMVSIEPLLATVFAGKPLDNPELLDGLSPVALWKLRNAIYARHGRPFKNPDLTTFFYGDRGKGAEKTALLPRAVDPAFSEKMLDKVDNANLRLIVAREGRP